MRQQRREHMEKLKLVLDLLRSPFHIPFFLRCFAMGVRCGKLGIDISNEEIVALCR
jgi:hypothetical protein